MNTPEQEQIDYWCQTAKERIERKWSLYNEGFYEREQIPVQGHYTGLGSWHAVLARAKFLNGDPLDEVRAEFANAARHVLKSFKMAYDPSDPDYLGNKADWIEVGETIAIDGMNYALMAANFDLARTLAEWFRDPGNGDLAAIEINRYVHALASTLRDEIDEAKRLMAEQAFDYTKNPVKGPGYRTNFFTVSTALIGILDHNDELFNQGLLAQLNDYQPYAQGEMKNTDEEFICDYAVALANLGLHHGLQVTVEYDTLPKGLLISA